MNTAADKRAVAEAHLEVEVTARLLKAAEAKRNEAERKAHYKGMAAYSVVVGDTVVTVAPPPREAGPTTYAQYTTTPLIQDGEA